MASPRCCLLLSILLEIWTKFAKIAGLKFKFFMTLLARRQRETHSDSYSRFCHHLYLIFIYYSKWIPSIYSSSTFYSNSIIEPRKEEKDSGINVQYKGSYHGNFRRALSFACQTFLNTWHKLLQMATEPDAGLKSFAININKVSPEIITVITEQLRNIMSMYDLECDMTTSDAAGCNWVVFKDIMSTHSMRAILPDKIMY